MRRILLTSLLVAACLVPVTGQAADAADDTNSSHTWDLSEIYATEDDWNTARNEVLAALEGIVVRRGTLGESASQLYEGLALVSDTSRKAARVFAYASLKADEDLRVTADQERLQLAQAMFAQLGESTAWMQPEILRIGRETIESYVREDERLERFAHQLDDIVRNAPHTLGDEAEATLAYFSQTFQAPSSIYSMVANSDIPWPEVTFSGGETARIDSQGYERFRSSANRDDRKKAFDAVKDILGPHPDLTGVFAINDECALGAYAALESRGKANDVVLIGFDGSPEAKQAILAGQIFADVVQYPGTIGAQTGQAIIDFFDGEDVPSEILVPTGVYAKADAESDPALQQ